MLGIIVFFLVASLLFYVIFGGADFGAGILELIARKKDSARTQELTYRALGPVWEANHMWLILAVVILFVGFPQAYAMLSTYLHIPLMIMLLGIVLRGTMFIFRHYDAVQDGSQIWYARLFAWSSFLTPLFLGMILGGSILGQIDPAANSFYAAYLAPWLNGFSIWLGLFFCLASAFLAAVFLTIESKQEKEKHQLSRKAFLLNVLMFGMGGIGLVGAGFFDTNVNLAVGVLEQYWEGYRGWLVMGVGTVLWIATQYFLLSNKFSLARIFAVGEISIVLLGWVWLQYPAMIVLKDGSSLSLVQAAAPDATLASLGWALIIGSVLIFPALYYLFRVFKR